MWVRTVGLAVSIAALALLAGCGSQEKSATSPPTSGGQSTDMKGMSEKDMKNMK